MNNLIPFLFSFKGRVKRKEFWIFEAVWIVLFVGLNVLTDPPRDENGNTTPSIIALVFALLTFWPLLAVQVKRWHDRNKSGWWIFIGLVPCIGGIWALVECGFLPSVDENNQFNS
jgi:uncharacterized membrane protein YhaH (DUF805 family)